MNIDDTKVIKQLEETVAKYSGAKYSSAISSATNGTFLCLELLKHKGIIKEGDTIEVPKRTYMSIPMCILNTRCKVSFRDEKWSGAYPIIHVESGKTIIWDSATRFNVGMFKNPLYVVSLQYRKLVPVGRGGIVITNNKEYKDLIDKLRFNGRTCGISQTEDKYTIKGWNMYLTPEASARALSIIQTLPEKNKDVAGYQDYPDLSKQEIFK